MGAPFCRGRIGKLLLSISLGAIVPFPIHPAAAVPLGFDGLDTSASGSGLPDFTSFTASGFSVTATPGNWFASDYGDPGPGIAAFNFGVRTLAIAGAGAPFRFDSVELDAFLVDAPYTFTGSLHGAVVFDASGLSPGSPAAAFTTAINPDASDVIDALAISVGAPEYPYYISLDNIVVSDVSVSEPASALIVGTCLGFLYVARRRRVPRLQA